MDATITADNFTSRNFWRNWEGYEWTARRFDVAPLREWQPAFGRMSQATRELVPETFTRQELARLQFVTYLARNYTLNEGI